MCAPVPPDENETWIVSIPWGSLSQRRHGGDRPKLVFLTLKELKALRRDVGEAIKKAQKAIAEESAAR